MASPYHDGLLGGTMCPWHSDAARRRLGDIYGEAAIFAGGASRACLPHQHRRAPNSARYYFHFGAQRVRKMAKADDGLKAGINLTQLALRGEMSMISTNAKAVSRK